MLTRSGIIGGASKPAFTAYDPSFSNSAGIVALSEGNLVATSLGGSYGFVRSTVANSTGKFFRSITLNVLTDNDQIGIVNAAVAASSGSIYLGADTNGIGYIPKIGAVYYNGSAVATIQTATAGQIVDEAVDLGAGLIWWRVNGGYWNNSSTANPATGTGGIALGVSGPFYAGLEFPFAAGEKNTTNFGATGYT